MKKTRSYRLRSLAPPCLLALVSAAVLTIAPPAQAAVGCSYDAGTHAVTVTLGPGDYPTIIRSGSAISVGGSACGDATVDNTDTITVTGSSGSEGVIVDLSNGVFAPGVTTETSGVSEIEIAIDLGAGHDWMYLEGTTGADSWRAGELGVNVNGDTDADISLGGVEQPMFYGFGGDDVFSAAGGLGTGAVVAFNVIMYGNDGNDALTGGNGTDAFYGGNGNDTLAGGADNDLFYGEGGADAMYGGAGDDTFAEETAANGGDVMSGGAGIYDTADYGDRSNPVAVTTSDGLANDGETGEADNVHADVETVDGGTGADTLTGGSANDRLDGGAGNDSLYGGGGDDTITGGPGNDSIFGGAGSDSIQEGTSANGSDVISGGADRDGVWYSGRSSAVAVTLGDGLANDGEAGESDLVRVDVEDVAGGLGNDTITGSSEGNDLRGYGGNDTLSSGDGNDLLHGGGDNDTIYAGAGNDLFLEDAAANGSDVFIGGAGADTVSYYNRTNAVSVTLEDALANDGEASEDDLVRVDVEMVDGGSGNDTIVGSSVANTLWGNAGDDTIYGGGGNDALYGDAGSDSLYGGEGDDNFLAQDGVADYLNGGNGTDGGSWDNGLDTLVSIP